MDGNVSSRINVGTKVANLLFPMSIYCISCGSIIDESRVYGLCDSCFGKFGWNTGKTCKRCGKALDVLKEKSRLEINEQESEIFTCENCKNRMNFFDKGYACTSYGLYERMLVSDLKEKRKTYLARVTAEIMYDRLRQENIDFDFIVPVPASKYNMSRRGFNQAELLARYMGQLIEKPVFDVLYRNRETGKMKEMNAIDRAMNVRDAFSMKADVLSQRDVSGKSTLLVDDVLTTGNTINNCAKALKLAGIGKVYTIVFAAGMDRAKNYDRV